MEPLKLLETSPGAFSLVLSDGDIGAVEAVVEELGHTPNGPFWDGVAITLIRTSAPELASALEFDSEAGMFCAYSANRDALLRLGSLMAPLVLSPERMTELMEHADPNDFDD